MADSHSSSPEASCHQGAFYACLVATMEREVALKADPVAVSILKRLRHEAEYPHPRRPAVCSYFLYQVRCSRPGTLHHQLNVAALRSLVPLDASLEASIAALRRAAEALRQESA